MVRSLVLQARRNRRAILFLLPLCFSVPSSVPAADRISAKWLPDGDSFWYQADPGEFVLIDARDGSRKPASPPNASPETSPDGAFTARVEKSRVVLTRLADGKETILRAPIKEKATYRGKASGRPTRELSSSVPPSRCPSASSRFSTPAEKNR